MTFHSSAKTAAEFRKEVCDHLQREATQIFNRKRNIEANSGRKKDIEELIIRFNQTCHLRDFFQSIHFED